MMYEIGFVAAAIGLFLWTALSGRSLAKGVFWLFASALATYLLGLWLSEATAQVKMGTMFRDLMVLSAVGVAAQILGRNPWHAFVGGLVLVAVMWLYQRFVLSATFVPTAEAVTAPASYEGPALASEGELLLQLHEGHGTAAIQTVLDAFGLSVSPAFQMADTDATLLDDYLLVDIPDAQLPFLTRIMEALQALPATAWLEANEVIQVDLREVPTPQRKGNPFGLNDPGVPQLWGFHALQMDKLYDVLDHAKATPKRKARLAIIDTGVDARHEDLAANFVSINPKHDTDPQGHGTHCAGIANAVSNNGVGVASFSRDNRYVEVTSVRVLNASGMGTQQTIINGMLEAADKGADVLSMSLGGRSTDSSQRAYKKAVDYAKKKGAIVVAAAGNAGRNAKDFAPVNTPGVIGVSAIDSTLAKAHFSNSVQDIRMAIAAPGVGIYSTKPNNQYAAHSGTSMATPYVAGLVALLKSLQPDLTAEQAHKLLHHTGIETAQTAQTGRMIQPHKAVEALLAKNVGTR